MELWEQLTKASLLGTQKHNLADLSLPASIRQLAGEWEGTDKEENFLKVAALVMNYTNAGKEFPLLQATLPLASEAETLERCSREAGEVLRRIIYEKQDDLLEVFLQELVNHKQRVPEDLIPELLDKGKEQPAIKDEIKFVSGKRGEWLAKMNPDWAYLHVIATEDAWQTGKLEERKEALEKVRRQDPAKARDWMQQVWKTENANTKAALLHVFLHNLSMADEPMLEEMLADKSQKVREVAGTLLGHLAGSRLIRRLWEAAREWIILKKSGSLLSKKTRLELHIPKPLPGNLIQDGIEPNREKFLKAFTSANPVQKWAVNGCTEPEIWLYQVMSAIPPSWWPEQLKINLSTFVNLLLNNDYSKFLPALIAATVLHKDLLFARALLEEFTDISKLFKPAKADAEVVGLKYGLIDILPDKQDYLGDLLNLLDNDNYLFYSYLQVFNYQWPMSVALKALRKIAEKCNSNQYYYYYYDARQVQKLSPYLPADILQAWPDLEPSADIGKARWQQATALLLNSLELKKRVREVFAD
jgi:hypothetical protein